jgi:nucleoside-diphosphate-sugar epimerase
MNVLLCGADGFFGRTIHRTLAAAGHRVIRGVHHLRFPGDVAID